MIKLLVITTLYPNQNQFRHGIFVENRVKSLVASGKTEALVMAPVPWVPAVFIWLLTAFSLTKKLAESLPLAEYKLYQSIPTEEYRFGIRVLHPRYLVIPKIGMYITPLLLALSLVRAVGRLRRSGEHWDLIDSHYFYPDGVAVALVASWLKLPFTVTARGSDINLISDYWPARKMMLWAASKSAKNLCVSAELKRKMTSLGMAADKIVTVTNGVDETVFVAKSEAQRAALNQQLPGSSYRLAAVGNLIELKGQHLLIEAVTSMPEVTLLIVGEGEARDSLEAQVRAAGLQQRVYFLGNLAQAELVDIYNGVDLVCLASSREGCANVLLEAIACGTPVLATDVGGNAETVNSDELGRLVSERSAAALCRSIRLMQHLSFDRQRIRTLSQRFWYSAINATLLQVYQSVIDSHRTSQELARVAQLSTQPSNQSSKKIGASQK